MRREVEVDLLVLGGGPAGVATALALKQRDASLRIILLEKSTYHTLRIGETLPPEARPALHALGLESLLHTPPHSPSYGICAAWGKAQLHYQDFLVSPYGLGWHLDRARFDQDLAQEAQQQGLQVLQGARALDLQPSPAGPWRCAVLYQGSLTTFLARFVVEATGRQQWLARRLKVPRRALDRPVGVYGWFEIAQPPPDHYTLIEAAPLGWWYSAFLPHHRLVVAFLTDAPLVQQYRLQQPHNWTAHLQQTQHMQQRLQGLSIRRQSLSVHPARVSILAHMVGERWLAVGDAAMTFDPLSAQGILKALREGQLAARVIEQYFSAGAVALQSYERQLHDAFRAYTTQAQWYYQQEQRWAESAFWSQRGAVPGGTYHA